MKFFYRGEKKKPNNHVINSKLPNSLYYFSNVLNIWTVTPLFKINILCIAAQGLRPHKASFQGDIIF